jgi:hypothetical protein
MPRLMVNESQAVRQELGRVRSSHQAGARFAHGRALDLPNNRRQWCAGTMYAQQNHC